MKKALIAGVTGQEGAYLSELLLKKGYVVHGIKRRSSLFNTHRIDHLIEDPRVSGRNFILHNGNLTDSTNLIRIIQEVQPDEIYNLGAMPHVKASFEAPEYMANTDAVGTVRILEAIRILGLTGKTKYYQASTSELYSKAQEVHVTEKTPFYPRSPYAVAKLYAYWITVNYREAYNMFACNGILFNHESHLQEETSVSRKITKAVAKIALGLQQKLFLGNLDTQRDWGHAADYVEAMYLMLQQDQPDDFVIATGTATSVREFVRMAFEEVGIELTFDGDGENEVGIVVGSYHPDYPVQTGATVVHIDSNYFRPSEAYSLVGNPEKAMNKLGWQPKHDLKSIVREMLAFDLELFKKNQLLISAGFSIKNEMDC